MSQREEPDSDSDSWKAEFRRRLTEFLALRGSPLRQNAAPYWDGYYGIIADDYQAVRAHVGECGLDQNATTWDESSWREFAGTFAEEDDIRYGIDLKATCRCGSIRDRVFRYEGTPGTLIRAITE